VALELAGLRKDYGLRALSREDLADDPLLQLKAWLTHAHAAGVREANAMTLATVGANGRPSSRIVLIKGIDSGLVWYTSYHSRKAVELAIHPFACLQFHWIDEERQVRIEGQVEKTSAAESDAYFASRPRPSQIGAWASPQSQVIASRSVLEQAEIALNLRYPNEVPRPPDWGGFRLIPDVFEFWQGRASRLHDRLVYRRAEGGWKIERLAP